MRRLAVVWTAAVGVWLAAMVGFAQAQVASVGRVVFLTAKPGMKAQLEEAIKRQMDWRREQKDDWRWVVWEYISGEEWGRFDFMFAGIVCFAILGFLSDRILIAVRRRALKGQMIGTEERPVR